MKLERLVQKCSARTLRRQRLRPFSLRSTGVLTPQVAAKQLVAAKRKRNGAVRSDRCCRSRVFNKHGRRMVAVILPLGPLGGPPCGKSRNKAAECRSNKNAGTKKAAGGHGRRVGQARA